MDILLKKPTANTLIVHNPAFGDVIVVDFAPVDATLTRVDANLVFTFNDNSEVSLNGFYNTYSSKQVPIFEVDGIEFDAEAFFAILNASDLLPASEGNLLNDNGAFFNGVDENDLLDRVDSLDRNSLKLEFEARVPNEDRLDSISENKIETAKLSVDEDGIGLIDDVSDPNTEFAIKDEYDIYEGEYGILRIKPSTGEYIFSLNENGENYHEILNLDEDTVLNDNFTIYIKDELGMWDSEDINIAISIGENLEITYTLTRGMVEDTLEDGDISLTFNYFLTEGSDTFDSDIEYGDIEVVVMPSESVLGLTFDINAELIVLSDGDLEFKQGDILNHLGLSHDNGYIGFNSPDDWTSMTDVLDGYTAFQNKDGMHILINNNNTSGSLETTYAYDPANNSVLDSNEEEIIFDGRIPQTNHVGNVDIMTMDVSGSERTNTDGILDGSWSYDIATYSDQIHGINVNRGNLDNINDSFGNEISREIEIMSKS